MNPDFILKDVERTTAAEAVRRALPLIGSRLGIIRWVGQTQINPSSPRIFVYAGEFADPTALRDRAVAQDRLELCSGGASTIAQEAEAAALGEGIERYALLLCSERDVQHMSICEAGDDACDARAFDLFSPAQFCRAGFPFVPADPNRSLGWREAVCLSGSGTALVPAFLLHLSYPFSHQEGPIGYCSSSGAAAGCTREEALLASLYEVIERDAVALTWLQRRSRPIVTLESAPAPVKDVLDRITATGLGVHVVDITTDVKIPVMLCAITSSSTRRPALAIGAACRVDPWQAVLKAVVEAAHTFTFLDLTTAGAELHRRSISDDPKLNTFKEHCKLFAYQDMLPHAEFLYASDRTVNLPPPAATSSGSIRSNIEACVAQLQCAGFEVYAVDMTPSDIQSVGFSVIRVVVPGLQPLWIRDWSFLGNKRLYRSVDADVERAFAESDLNPIPHPFP